MKDAIKRIREAMKRSRERVKSIPLRTREEQQQEAKRIAKVFLVVATICGLMITFVLPPLCAPDENVHFVNVYSMSHGKLFADEHEGKLVRWIPKSFYSYISIYPLTLQGLENNNRYHYQNLYKDSIDGLNEFDGTPVPFETSITSTGYLISAASMYIGRQLGRLLDLPHTVLPYNQIVLGRIGNLLFYVIIIYLAIKRAPHFNKTMALIALMPMSLFLGSSLSYDAILIPLSLYFIAMILDLCTEPDSRISIQDIIRVIICVLMISGMKSGAYIPMFALLLTIPKKKYGNLKRMILCIAGVAAAAFIGYLPSFIIGTRTAKLEAAAGVITEVAKQKQWMTSNIAALPQLILTTFAMRHGVYLSSFWGQIGWLDAFFPNPIMILWYVILGIVCIGETCTFDIWRGKRWKNLLAAAGAIVSMIGIMFGLYIYFTPVGNICIEGVQGRYFIPLFLGFALAVSNPALLQVSFIRNGTAGRKATTGTLIWGSCYAAMTVLILLIRYWIS